MREPHEIHIQFPEETINLERFKQVLKALNTTFGPFDEAKATQEFRDMPHDKQSAVFDSPPISVFFTRAKAYNNAYGNDKDQIYIKTEHNITVDQFTPYLQFIEELPPDARISGGDWSTFDGDYKIDKIRQITVIPKYELSKYNEDRILSFDKAYKIRKMANRSILIWLKKEDVPYVYTDVSEEIQELKKHLGIK